jgi:hypothetical protein
MSDKPAAVPPEQLEQQVEDLQQKAQEVKKHLQEVEGEVKEVEQQADDLKEQVHEVKEEAKEVYREARPWLVRLGRIGFAAKGVVYVALGLLIMRAAQNGGSANVDQESTLRAISIQPFFGPLLLGLIAIGLAGYVLWMMVQAFADPQEYGRDLRGIFKRGVYVVKGLSYAGLMLIAVQLLLGLGYRPQEDIPDWTRPILGSSFGPWLVGLVGVGFLAYFFFLGYIAFTGKFKKKLELMKMEEEEMRWAIRAGRIGLIGRGLLILVVGGFLVDAAFRYNPEKAGGLGDILAQVAQQPYGHWMLGGVALGLVAYGMYSLILVRYGRYLA